MLFVNSDGKLISSGSKTVNKIEPEVEIKRNVVPYIEINTDSNGATYILFRDVHKKMTISRINYWKKYISHNIEKIKTAARVEYIVVEFADKNSLLLWN